MLSKSTAGHLAGPTDPAGLQLERLPSGEFAWLRPLAEEPCYVVTDLGRRALAEAWVFEPGPTVAEAFGELAA